MDRIPTKSVIISVLYVNQAAEYHQWKEPHSYFLKISKGIFGLESKNSDVQELLFYTGRFSVTILLNFQSLFC